MAEPVIAQKAPFTVEVAAGRRYWWCACGRSQKQPFCDGSHAGTGLEPVQYSSEVARKVFFCGCKASGKAPLCDGSHSRL